VQQQHSAIYGPTCLTQMFCRSPSFALLSDQRPIDVVPSDEKEVNNRIKEILQKDMNEAPTKEVKEV
jgi:hypothetical protein